MVNLYKLCNNLEKNNLFVKDKFNQMKHNQEDVMAFFVKNFNN
jgi:hypothetical protein